MPVGWSPTPSWRYKLMWGTAYRTPFARQLYEEGTPDLEEVRSLNLQIAWEKPRRAGFSVTGFFQWLDDHVMEDPYAGLSLPNEQKIYGLEIEAHLSPHPSLDIEANLTLLNNRGSEERYRYLERIEFDSDYERRKHRSSNGRFFEERHRLVSVICHVFPKNVDNNVIPVRCRPPKSAPTLVV